MGGAAAGETVGVLGPSGAGKTSLLMIMAGLESLTGGSISLAENDITTMGEDALAALRRDQVGIVFQAFRLIPSMTALQNVAVPMELAGRRDADEMAATALEAVGLGHRKTHLPDQMSGGEQQRVAIARAIATRPRILLADEPTGALDPITSREVLALFDQLHKEDDVAFLLVTHSKEVASFCERSLELREGRFIAQHGVGVDIGDLSDSREFIVDDSGTVTLPPDVLLKIGGPGRFEVQEIERDMLHLERVAEEREEIEGSGKMTLSPSCPACFHQYGESDEQLCPECGSSRPMVQA